MTKREDLTDATTQGATTTAGALGARLALRVASPTFFHTHPIPPVGELVLGRAPEADVTIPHRSVSRRHAILRAQPGLTPQAGTPGLSIEDLGSSNGTRVSGRRIASGERVAIQPGSVVEVGSVTVVVQRIGGVGAPAEQAPVLAQSGAMRRVYDLVDRIADGAIHVLVLGETGTGKDVVARLLHARSSRSKKPFLAINCAAVGEQLVESELFGHEKGAFTGALQSKPGLLEMAEGGTVLLDEIGEMPPGLQAKLLRVLEDRLVRRVGGVKARAVDVRFVAATNRDLAADAAAGRFRQDLFFRLNGVAVRLPPLRERVTDIGELARAFASEHARESGRPEPRLAAESLALLEAHAWPGNVRELKNAVARAVLLATGDALTPDLFHLDKPDAPLPPDNTAEVAEVPAVTVPPPALEDKPLKGELAQIERRRIEEALARCAGNQSEAAKLLGLSRNTLLARIRTYGLPRPRRR
jgi:DNA-binding NtrC family response regulator